MKSRSGNRASRLVYGALTLGRLQKNYSVERASQLLLYGYEKGINILDTAELYENYDQIGEFLNQINRNDYIIISKSYAYDGESAKRSIDLALTKMKTSYIDAFLMHEQESIHTFRGHEKAFEYYLEMQSQGVIDRVGISTHFVAGAKVAVRDERISVLHPIINVAGLGIQDGSRADMEEQVGLFSGYSYAMKVFGGGNLLHSRKECLDYILALDSIGGIAIGMQSEAEIDYNSKLIIEGKYPDTAPPIEEKKLFIQEWCTGCGNCISACQHKALELVDGFCNVDHDKCVKCGYCSASCPDMCIKIY